MESINNVEGRFLTKTRVANAESACSGCVRGGKGGASIGVPSTGLLLRFGLRW